MENYTGGRFDPFEEGYGEDLTPKQPGDKRSFEMVRVTIYCHKCGTMLRVINMVYPGCIEKRIDEEFDDEEILCKTCLNILITPTAILAGNDLRIEIKELDVQKIMTFPN